MTSISSNRPAYRPPTVSEPSNGVQSSAPAAGVAGAEASGTGESTGASALRGSVLAALTQFTEASKSSGAAPKKTAGKAWSKDKFLQKKSGKGESQKPAAVAAGRLSSDGQAAAGKSEGAGQAAPTRGLDASQASDARSASGPKEWDLGGGVTMAYHASGTNNKPQLDLNIGPKDKVTLAAEENGNMMMSIKGEDGKERYLYFTQDDKGNYYLRANQSDPRDPNAWSEPVPLNTKDAPALCFMGPDGKPVSGENIHNVNLTNVNAKNGTVIVPEPRGGNEKPGKGQMPANMTLWQVMPVGGEWGMGGF
jgi:hypothetical protein